MENKISNRVNALRRLMSERNIATFIIPGTDPHLSEYIAEHWKSRDWVSGFNGSAGTVVIATDEAGLWTDSRYFLQADAQLKGSGIKLYKQGLPDTPTITEWLAATLPSGSTVAIDGSLFSAAETQRISQFFQKYNIRLITDFTPFDLIWEDRPSIPMDHIFIHPETFSGESLNSKITKILERISQEDANATLLTALDEIAWTLNLRGTDVECNPVAICYAYLSDKERILFADVKKIDKKTAEYLKKYNIQLAEYGKIHSFLKSLPQDITIWIDPNKVNFSLLSTIPQTNKIVLSGSPIALLKSIKNETEISGFREAMVRDGVALVKFFRWLDQHIDNGEITERTVGDKLNEFRGDQTYHVGESFGTIAGFNEHGAIVHYKATPESDATLSRKGFLLVDSGAQYFDGTTDITRTIALGDLTEQQKKDYTLVLKGHIAIATCRFPQGTRGAQIDVLARHFLWDNGLNYLHGTGHGIGHFLNVHEGPQNIRMEENPTPLIPGMVTSNEPGVYRANEYGIRIENLILTVDDRLTDFGRFYKFETLTLFPIDKKGINKNMLTPEEIEWLNKYHQQVYDRLSPLLDNEEKCWLRDATSSL